MSNSNVKSVSIQTTDANATIAVVQKNLETLPVKDENSEIENTQPLPMGKLMDMVAEILGLDQVQTLQLGVYAITNQDELIKVAMQEVHKEMSFEKAFNVIFKGSPVKPEFKTVVTNLESKFDTLLDRLFIFIGEWTGQAAADKLRTQAEQMISEIKTTGVKTNWEEKAELIKAKVITSTASVRSKLQVAENVEAEMVSFCG